MFIISGHILTFSTGSAGLRTNSSDSLLNRNSSFGRPSFFNSYNVWFRYFFWKENSTLSSSCLSTGAHLLALFSTVTMPFNS